MMHKLAVLLLGVVAASAADVDGKWRLTYATGNSLVRNAVLELKTVEGKLSGSLTSERGSARIETGGVQADEIWFNLLRKGNGDEIEVVFRGRIDKGVLHLKMQYAKHDPVTVEGRRI